jgi:hypothetical protein
MDDERLKNDGSILGKKYFEEQLQQIACNIMRHDEVKRLASY